MSTPNPYAAPRAPVADATLAAPRNFVPTGRAVAAARGWAWIAQAWELFKRQPFMWVALTIVGIAILVVPQILLPIVGWIAAMVLGPVFVGGIMIGCRDLDEGRELQFAHLFAGFRERFGSLVSVGLISLGFTFAVALLAGLGGFGTATLLGSGADSAAVAGASLTLLLMVLVMLALLLPLYMAMWFAPALMVFHAQGPGKAMKNSFVACLKNIVPFFLYSVIFFLLSFVASLPVFLGWLVLGPVMAASLYTSYRDIFFE